MHALLLAIAVAQTTPAPSASPSGTLSLSSSSVNLNPAQQQIVTVTGATPPLTLSLEQKLVTVTADPRRCQRHDYRHAGYRK